MKNKKVYTAISTVKDMHGNILSRDNKAVVLNKAQESFIMITITNGLDWIKPIQGYLAFLVCLFNYADHNGIVSLTPLRKSEITSFFGWKNKKQIDQSLIVLVKHDCIKRIGRGDYIINPETLFRGGTITKAEKSNLYQSIL